MTARDGVTAQGPNSSGSQVDGLLMRSSSVRTYESCPRKWLLQYTRKDALSSAAMDFGTEMHLHLENWYKSGKIPPGTPTGLAARTSMKHLPAPGEHLLPEHNWLRALRSKGIEYTYSGTLDLMDDRVYWDADGKRYMIFYDHKSTAGIKWAKTPTELADDVSACAYALWMIDVYDLDYVTCKWVYTQRDAKLSIPVVFTITKEQAQARWARTMKAVDEMIPLMAANSAAAPLSPDTLPGNFSACDEFGGCTYIEICDTLSSVNEPVAISPLVQINRKKKEDTNMALSPLLTKLQNRLPVKPAAATAAPSTPVLAKGVNPPDGPQAGIDAANGSTAAEETEPVEVTKPAPAPTLKATSKLTLSGAANLAKANKEIAATTKVVKEQTAALAEPKILVPIEPSRNDLADYSTDALLQEIFRRAKG